MTTKRDTPIVEKNMGSRRIAIDLMSFRT